MDFPEFKGRLLEDIPYSEYRGVMDGYLRQAAELLALTLHECLMTY